MQFWNSKKEIEDMVNKMAKNKERLDKILTDKGYFETKSKAQGAIMAGDVKINDEVITKAGYLLELKETTKIEIKSLPFVSRGGLKLDKAITSSIAFSFSLIYSSFFLLWKVLFYVLLYKFL